MRGTGTTRALCALVAIICCLGFAPAALAKAAPVKWATPVLADHSQPFSSPNVLAAVACPTSTTCLAVGDNGTIDTVKQTSPSVVSGVDGGAALQGIACPSASLCVIEEPARLIVSTDPTSAHPTWTHSAIPPRNDLFAGITCASDTLCLAWSDSTTVQVSTDPAGAASTWHPQVVASPSTSTEVASAVCAPGSTLCVASLPGGSNGFFSTSSDPAAGASSWSVTSEPPGTAALVGMTCASATLCAGFQAGAIATSVDPAAGASSWSSGAIFTPTAPVFAAFTGIACPSTTTCLAAVSNGAVATSTNASAGPSSFTLSPVIDSARLGTANDTGIACPGTTSCLVPDETPGLATVTLGNPPAATVATGLGGTTRIAGLDCPAANLCLGVDGSGAILHTANPAGPASAWHRTVQTAASSGFNPGLDAVDCPSVHFCIAGGNNDVLQTTTHPATATQWSETTLPFQIVGGSGETFVDSLGGISCVSAKLCVMGNSGFGLLASTNPAGGASAWHLDPVGAFDADTFTAVSCPTAKLCVAGDNDFGRIAVSTQPGAAKGHWKIKTIAKGVGSLAPGIGAVSCPSASFCLAGDTHGAIHWTTNPTGGPSAWHSVKIAGGRLIGASCRSRSFCVVTDALHDVFASTDPMGGKGAWHDTTLATGHFPIANPGSENLTALACAPHHVCVAASGAGLVFPGRTAK
jgi:hypothetical protein